MSGKLRVAAVLGAMALITATLVSTAGATGGQSIARISGTETVIDESNGVFALHGSLVGTQYTTSFVPQYLSSSSIVATGTELFVGCLDANANCDAGEPSGTIDFKFVYWATYDPVTQALIHGACVHPVVGGTGSFAKSRGLIFMTDTPTAGGVVTTYTGTLTYGSGAVQSVRLPAAGASRAGAGACGS